MVKLVFFSLLAVIAIELYVLVAVAQKINVLPTLLLAFGSAVLGLRVLIKQTRKYMATAQQQLAQGLPVNDLFAQVILMFFCGVCLILPGLISDVIGLCLLIPMFRTFLISVGVVPKIDLSKLNRSEFTGGNVFEGEFTDAECEKMDENTLNQQKHENNNK